MTQELVPTNTLFHMRNVINSGPLSRVPQNIEGYVKDFKIAYSEEGVIDQFYSDLSIYMRNKGPTQHLQSHCAGQTDKTIVLQQKERPTSYPGKTPLTAETVERSAIGPALVEVAPVTRTRLLARMNAASSC